MNNIIIQDLEYITEQDIPWNYFDGKYVLVTGATGMLATYIVETLLFIKEKLNINVTVLALSRDIIAAKKKYSEHKKNVNLIHIKADLNYPFNIEGRVDVVIHTASYASPKFYKTDPVGTIKPNLLGTLNLLDMSVEKKVEKFLFFSSGEIYGKSLTDDNLCEENIGSVDPMNLRSSYAESKKMAETMCVAWAEQYNIDVKIVRPFHTYGPGMKLDDGRVFSDFVSNILNNENITLKSDGDFKRPFCYISDATRGFFTVLLKGESKNAYNVANPDQNIKIRDLAKKLQEEYSNRGIKVDFDVPIDNPAIMSTTKEQLPIINKIKKLGWEPCISVHEGFTRTVKSYE